MGKTLLWAWKQDDELSNKCGESSKVLGQPLVSKTRSNSQTSLGAVFWGFKSLGVKFREDEKTTWSVIGGLSGMVWHGCKSNPFSFKEYTYIYPKGDKSRLLPLLTVKKILNEGWQVLNWNPVFGCNTLYWNSLNLLNHLVKGGRLRWSG